MLGPSDATWRPRSFGATIAFWRTVALGLGAALFSPSTLGAEDDRLVLLDDENDAVFVDERRPAFDLKLLELKRVNDHTLSITFLLEDKIEVPVQNYGWYGLYLDLDNNSTTGMSAKGIGADFLIGLEPSRQSNEWIVETTIKSDFLAEEDFSQPTLKIEGDTATITLESPIFAEYSPFRVRATSHVDRKFVDWIPNKKAAVFDFISPGEKPEGAAPNLTANHSFMIDAKAGHYDREDMPIPPGSKAVELTMTPTNRFPHQRWGCAFGAKIQGADEDDRVFLRLSEGKDAFGFRIAKVFSSGRVADETKLKKAIDLQEKVVLRFQWTKSRIRVYLNGKKLDKLNLEFKPQTLVFSVSSMEAQVDSIRFE